MIVNNSLAFFGGKLLRTCVRTKIAGLKKNVNHVPTRHSCPSMASSQPARHVLSSFCETARCPLKLEQKLETFNLKTRLKVS